MRDKWQRWCYRQAQRLMKWSGSAGATEWFEAQEMRRLALQKFCVAEDRRLTAERKFRDFFYTARLVDGLISAGHPDRAQEQLRVAIIAAGRP